VWGLLLVGGIKVSGRLEGVFLARGPCSLRVAEGSIDILGGSLRDGGFVIVPSGRAVAFRSSGAVVEVSGCVPERVGDEEYSRFEEAAGALKGYGRVVLVGPTDSGKSTLATWILNSWGSGSLLEADVGQNEIFAPGFEALASHSGGIAVPGYVESFGGVKPCFVGSFTPSSAESKYIACAASLARAAGGRLVVDTDGWVQPWGGLYSKAALALAVGADVIASVGLERRMARILEDLTGVEVVPLGRLVSSAKSREERESHRDRLLSRRLIGARERRVSFSEVEVRGAPILFGEEASLEEARKLDPSAVYAEVQPGWGLAIVSRAPQRRPGVKVVRAGWEQGLLSAVHGEDGSVEVGVLLSVDYRSKKLTVATRLESRIKTIEVGLVRVDYRSLAGIVRIG
jgi:polynucleotide 5'-hydroxyl-kinase GRC3/NOL9